MVRHRLFITILNLIFPPLAVLLIAGGGWDCILNCIFFILAVIPSHVHGFYVTCTYFHRKNKVQKDRYPGGPKTFIESQYVLNGGASDAEVERLWRKENGKAGRSNSRRYSNSPSPNHEIRYGDKHASAQGSRLMEYDYGHTHHSSPDGRTLVLRQPSSYSHLGGFSLASPVASETSRQRSRR